jgi:hypothetical protein
MGGQPDGHVEVRQVEFASDPDEVRWLQIGVSGVPAMDTREPLSHAR